MIAIWTKPDGTCREILSLDDCVECLTELDDLYTQALLEERKIDAALLAVEREDLFACYVPALKVELRRAEQEVTALVERARL